MELAACDDGCRAWAAVDQCELAEVVDALQCSTGGSRHRLGLSVEDEVEDVASVSGEDDRLAGGELGQRCVAQQFAETAFADALEEWVSRELVGPVAGGRPIPAPWQLVGVDQ